MPAAGEGLRGVVASQHGATSPEGRPMRGPSWRRDDRGGYAALVVSCRARGGRGNPWRGGVSARGDFDGVAPMRRPSWRRDDKGGYAALVVPFRGRGGRGTPRAWWRLSTGRLPMRGARCEVPPGVGMTEGVTRLYMRSGASIPMRSRVRASATLAAATSRKRAFASATSSGEGVRSRPCSSRCRGMTRQRS